MEGEALPQNWPTAAQEAIRSKFCGGFVVVLVVLVCVGGGTVKQQRKGKRKQGGVGVWW